MIYSFGSFDYFDFSSTMTGVSRSLFLTNFFSKKDPLSLYFLIIIFAVESLSLSR